MEATQVTAGRPAETRESDRRMSSESRTKLLRKLVQLEYENKQLQTQIAERDQTIEQQSAQLDEVADFLESLPDVDALTKQVADYETAIREGVTRAAWEEEAAKLGVDPKYFDDLWKLDAPELSDEPDAKALAAHLAKSIEGRQVMLAAPSDDDETEAEEPDEEEADSDDETEGATAGRKPMSIFDVAPPKKPAPGKAPGTPQDGPAAKPRPGRAEAPAKPQGGKLTASAGASRGSRDSQRRETVDDVVDREFAETGRTDDFRI